ncbi:hypothetical protein EIL87_04670 [Saccharopolyspora rhizosphaerae]|uniref:Tetratricopeptide repeat protein n=1 Tax=Saccharopolyspora rhizosphaerae TaxID=2492662 RepID=A0A3R8P9N0_9PSEU|nr:hypothetical protein [Saccharopolyspora rhizosphaerae]RRO19396.1 hypothetical protein EIL87_04670 [Saccharopolyspora rhizosphaerae]
MEGLLDPAWQMRWRVPELALALSDRAAALARRTGDRSARLRAEALALFASNRLGRGVAATGRALEAVRDAETAAPGDVLTRLRIELGWCAVHAGSHEVAVRVLRRELARDRVEPALRAHALLALAAALPAQQDVDERSEALDEAERLHTDDDSDTTRVLQARVWAARAGHRRRLGEFGEAVAATDVGLGLLRRLSDPEADGGEVQTRLLLERVHALLDQGHRVEAVETSQAVLAEPVRAAAAGPTGWLGLALATRVHLPAGDHDAALRVLAETAAISERHELDGLLAEALNALSRAYERVEEVSAALQALRGAYSADRRWRALVHNARVALIKAYPPETEEPRRRRSALVAAVPDPEPAEPEAVATAPEAVLAESERASARSAPEAVPESAAARTEPAHAAPGPDAPAPGKGVAESERGPAHSAPEAVPESAAARTEPAHSAPEPVAAPELEAARTEPAHSTHRTVGPEPASPAPEPAATSHHGSHEQSRRGGYAEAHDAARLLMEALTSRAKEAEEEPPPTAERPEQAPEPFAERAMPEPRVAFDSTSPSEMFGSPPERVQQAAEPEEEPAGQHSTGTWWPSDEPERLAIEDEESGGFEDGDDDGVAQRWSGDPLAAAADSLRRITAAHDRREQEPEPATPAHGVPAAEPEDVPAQAESEEPGGRRSKGKSLAEIRAELKLPADHQPSRRRARHADSDPLAAFQTEPATPTSEAAESSTRPAEETDPSFRLAAAEPEPHAADEPQRMLEPEAAEEPEPQPEPEPVPPEPSPDASLADLLADALMAYNAGRTDEAKQQVSEGIAAVNHGRRHKPGYGEPGRGDERGEGDAEHIDHTTGGVAGRKRHRSTEDDHHEGVGARHRAPGIGSAAVDPLL